MPLTPIPKDQLTKVGVGAQRPEDVVVSRDGRVWLSDPASAAAEALPDGTLNRVGNAGGTPNGINMDAEGRIVIANVGGLETPGGRGPVQRLDVDTGAIEVLADQIDGIPLVSSNYPHVDSQGTHLGHPFDVAVGSRRLLRRTRRLSLPHRDRRLADDARD